MKFGRRGMIGEGTLMIYRVFMVSFVALVILGMSSVFYAHHIDVRDVEASIMARNIVNCLVTSEEIKISEISEVDLLEYCEYTAYGGQIYLDVSFKGSSGEEVLNLVSGDSGALFVQQIQSNGDLASGENYKSISGYYSSKYPAIFEGNVRGEIDLEVIVSDAE